MIQASLWIEDTISTIHAAGNVLQLEQNLGPGTVTTTYTYDDANQLSTADVENTTWHYTYDANGSLTEVLPNGNIASGAKRYTYNVAGDLIQVDEHDGTAWNTQAQMNYNGLNQRLPHSCSGADPITEQSCAQWQGWIEEFAHCFKAPSNHQPTYFAY